MEDKQNKASINHIKGIVNKMLKDVPEHNKNGTTVIKKNGKVYVFNYKRRKAK